MPGAESLMTDAAQHLRRADVPVIDVWQKRRQQANGWQKRANRIDALDADVVGELAESGGTHAAHAKGEAEEHA